MKDEQVKVGIIGYGTRGFLRAVCVNFHPRAHLAALCETNINMVKTIQSLGISVPLYTDTEEMLADTELDIVFVCTPNKTHLPLSQLCVDRKRNVFIEMPLAESASAARLISNREDPATFVSGLGGLFPLQKTFQKAKALLSENLIHPIKRIRASVYQSFSPENDSWYIQKEQSGGGVLSHLGSPLFHVLHWMFGPPHSIFAHASTRSFSVEDSASVIFELPNDIMAYCDMSWRRPGFPDPSIEIVVEGTRGILEVNSDLLKLYLYNKNHSFDKGWTTIDKSDISPESPFIYQQEGYFEETDCFIQNVLSKKPYPFNWKLGAEVAKTVSGAYQSAALSKRIHRDEVQYDSNR